MHINPPTLFFATLGAIFAAGRAAPLLSFGAPWLWWFGLVSICLGIAISVAGSRMFARIGTNIFPFRDPDVLVSDGLYAYSRNPMYLGLVLAVIGAVLMSGTLAALILASAFAGAINWIYIPFEETAMQRTFGHSYQTYCQQVSRWIGRSETAAQPRKI